jgi:hypothetical protein
MLLPRIPRMPRFEVAARRPLDFFVLAGFAGFFVLAVFADFAAFAGFALAN